MLLETQHVERLWSSTPVDKALDDADIKSVIDKDISGAIDRSLQHASNMI